MAATIHSSLLWRSATHLRCFLGSSQPVRVIHTTLPCLEDPPFLYHRPDINAIKFMKMRVQVDSGDKEGMPKKNLDRLRPGFDQCKELKDAHPEVVRMCSMEFATGRDRRGQLELDLIKKVQRFGSDYQSMEVRIARITAQIRVQKAHYEIAKSAGMNKKLLIEAVNRRKKYLQRLRAWDYDKFCWVLEQLNLEFGNPDYKARATRRQICVALNLKEALEIRRDKFIKYHAELKTKQPDFLVRKEKELVLIEEEEKRLREELETLKVGDVAPSLRAVV